MGTKCVFLFYSSPFRTHSRPACTYVRRQERHAVLHSIPDGAQENISEEVVQPVLDAHGVQAGFTQLGRVTARTRTSLPITMTWDGLECSCVECVELEFERVSITGSGRIADTGARLQF